MTSAAAGRSGQGAATRSRSIPRPAWPGSPCICGCSASSRTGRRDRLQRRAGRGHWVNPAKLRKDSYIGSYGIRGVGYEVSPLLHQLERTLGLTYRQAVALVGVGNLGHALAGYGGFGGRGFPIVALFDVDPDLVGISINGIVVDPVRDILQVCAERGVTIGIIATPGQAAQGVCDVLVRCGVQCILNFAPSCFRCRRRSRSARSTSPSSCRSSPSTSRAGTSAGGTRARQELRERPPGWIGGVVVNVLVRLSTAAPRSRCSSGPPSRATRSPSCSTSCCAGRTSPR